MARLLPSDLTAAALSGANACELETLNRLRTELSNDYCVYHSVHWSSFGRDSSRHGEIDFAIINRSGDVLIIEQKNGPLEETPQGLAKRYRNGPKCLNSQIERNTWNLRDRFKRCFGDDSQLEIDHLIYCPDHHIVSIDAPGIDASRTVDAAASANLIGRITELLGAGTDSNDNRTEIVCDFFSQTFRVVPDVSSYVSTQTRVYTQMLEGLTDAIGKLEFSPFRLRVIGTAGCGKSQLALDFCNRQLEHGRRPLLLCFNRPLADRLRALTPDGVTVDTYYGFCKKILEALNPDVTIQPTQEHGFWRGVQEKLVDVEIPRQSHYDCLIVDEGQDFKQEWWEILDLFLADDAPVLWLEDPSQNLRDTHGTDLDGFVTYRENANFRSPASIARFIQTVLGVEFRQRNELPGMGVNVEFYDNDMTQRKLVAHRITELVRKGFSHEEIVVVSCRGVSSSAFSDCEKFGALPVRKFTQQYTDCGEQIYTDGRIYFDSIYRFKGQQAPAVILVDIDESIDDSDLKKRVLYCGMTRATVRLELLVHAGSPWRAAIEAAA